MGCSLAANSSVTVQKWPSGRQRGDNDADVPSPPEQRAQSLSISRTSLSLISASMQVHTPHTLQAPVSVEIISSSGSVGVWQESQTVLLCSSLAISSSLLSFFLSSLPFSLSCCISHVGATQQGLRRIYEIPVGSSRRPFEHQGVVLHTTAQSWKAPHLSDP